MVDGASDSFLDDMIGAAQIKFKGNVFTGDTTRMVVVEPRSLAQQWLIDSNGWPLQSIVTFAGMKKSFKTTTLLEVCGEFVREPYQGKAVLVHCETKWSTSKVTGLLGELAKKILTPAAEGIDQERGWQPMLSHFLDYMESNAPDTLFFGGVDAITSPPTEEMEGKIEESGAGVGRSFQDKAAVLTTYTSWLAKRIIGFPWIICLTNHLKENLKAINGIKSYHTPGGVAPGFFTSLDIRLKRTKEIDKAGITGAEINWSVNDSSIGKDKRNLIVPVYESYDEAGSQITWFDWETALVRLLMELQSSTTTYADLKNVCKIVEYPSSPWPLYGCQQLGVDREKAIAEKWTATKLGAAIQTNPEMRAAVQKALRIQMHEVWTPAYDWKRVEKTKKVKKSVEE